MSMSILLACRKEKNAEAVGYSMLKDLLDYLNRNYLILIVLINVLSTRNNNFSPT